MALPENFDINTMSQKGGSIANRISQSYNNIVSRPQVRSTYSVYSQRESLWERFDNFISNIGDWFEDNAEDAGDILAIILFGIYVLAAIVTVVYIWYDDGFWAALLAAAISAALAYVCFLIIGILMAICKVVMGLFRWYFLNGCSFLIVNIAIAITTFFCVTSNSSNTYNNTKQTEISVPATTEYVCTANEFINIRVSPNTKANVLGRVKRGESVYVYEIKNGFAKVKYGSGYGYANANYIKKKVK